MPLATPTATSRLISLDVFRGLTVMAMVVVNNPGDWGHIYPPLEHAAWNGCTPTDLVFPFFLFIVGVSLAYALGGVKQRGEPQGPVLWQVLRRAAVLFGLGLLTSLYPHFDFSEVRIPGVLQRIGLVFLGCSVLYLKTNWHTQVLLLLTFLVGYAVLLQVVPVPGVGPANLEPTTNLGAWLDRTLLTEAHLWPQSRTWDPEGLLGTLPALGTGLMGVLAAQWLRRTDLGAPTKIRGLLGAGILAALLGLLWNNWFPINKALWTSSFVLFAGGLALVVLAGLYWLCDVRGHQRWATPAIAFGVNAIAVFVGSALLSRTSDFIQLAGPGGQKIGLQEWLYQRGIVPFFSDPHNASLAGAVVCLLIWLAVLNFLYRRRWVWKV
jgi:predicted acyltransferase